MFFTGLGSTEFLNIDLDSPFEIGLKFFCAPVVEGFSKIFHTVNLEVACMTSTLVIIGGEFGRESILVQILAS